MAWSGTRRSGELGNWSWGGGGGGTVDVLTNQGRLLVATQDAKAVATKMPPVGDADLTYTYRFDDRSSLSGFRTVLRGDGAFPLTSGYRLEILSDSTAIKVRRFSGTIGTVCQTGCSYTYTKDTNAQQVRFQVPALPSPAHGRSTGPTPARFPPAFFSFSTTGRAGHGPCCLTTSS
jgi:hypothetical protein